MSTTTERGVQSVTEVWDGGRNSGIDEFGNRHYTRHWNVKVDDVKVDALEATASGALPALFSHYVAPNGGTDFGATLRSYECQQLESGVLWRVTGSYSSAKTQQPLEYNPGDFGTIGGGGLTTGDAQETDPLLRAPTIRFGTLRYQKFIPRDLDNKPFTASNGQRLDPPPLFDRSYIVLSISRNESFNSIGGVPQFDPDTIINFKDKVNSTQWLLQHALIQDGVAWPVDPGVALCSDISAESQVEQNKLFWRVNYVFHINPYKKHSDPNDAGSPMIFEGWQPEVLDVGTYQWALVGGPAIFKRQNIKDQSGAFVTTPVALNGQGQELLPTNNVFPPVFAYKYRNFRTYESANFNILALP